MKKITRIAIIILMTSGLISCADQYEFTKKKEINILLNNLSEGDFYTCNLVHLKNNNSKSKKSINNNPNKNITMVLKNKKIGLIYKRDKWNNGNSIYKSHEDSNVYKPLETNIGDLDNIEKNKSDIIIKFNGVILKTNLLEEDIYNKYNCTKVENMLSEAAKRQIIKNFLYPRNKDRLE